MYMNFWYPVCLSADLTAAAPTRARILGLPFVAFRAAGAQAHVLADTCVHRGGALGRGKIVNGHLACPYHGWQFDGSGQCVHIPSLGADGPIPARAKVDSYPVLERYGIVFAFLGDLPEAERAPLYTVPEYDQPGWRPGLVVYAVDTYFERSIENGLDPVHNEFVHDLQGNIRFRPDRMNVTTDEWSSTVSVKMDPPKKGTTQLDARMMQINLAVADEDVRVITRLNPVRTPEAARSELLMVGDEGVGLYRKHLKEWEQRGWRLNLEVLREKAGDVAYAIPSPARRLAKNWVLDAVPLVAGDV